MVMNDCLKYSITPNKQGFIADVMFHVVALLMYAYVRESIKNVTIQPYI